MILKIKDRGQWHFIDGLTYVIDCGLCLVENHRISNPRGQGFTPERGEQLIADKVFVSDCLDENGDGEGLCLHVYKDTFEGITIVVCESYLLNNEGKTIERLST